MNYVLLGADGRPYGSDVKGQWGGHRGTRIYGRLDCPSALRAIARGGYARHRVFFADELTALAAGYRPCGICCADRYQAWKAAGHATGSKADKNPGRRAWTGPSPTRSP
jgi:hypothetical protein